MEFTFEDAITALGGAAGIFRYANQVPPASEYMFASLLPERNDPEYSIRTGTMTIRATMAGLSATDSPYAPGGVAEVATFVKDVAKITNQVAITEAALRRIQSILARMTLDGQNTLEFLQNEVLNFLEHVVLQAHMDRMEWLRGKALTAGAINWSYNGISLVVDYGIPADNFLANRTGNDAWDGSTSKFWDDIRLLATQLRYNVAAYICHVDTLMAIVNNDANKADLVRQSGNLYTLRRLVGDNDRPSSNMLDTVTIAAYQREGEILDTANPGQTTTVKFMPTGKILAVGRNTETGYRVGMGAQPDPEDAFALGYTHLAPTVEGGGRPGRWAQVYMPENLPMQLHGRAVTNGLPVIEAPKKVAVASSDLS